MRNASLTDEAVAAPLSKAAAFRAELVAPALTFIMEAHDGLSARVVEEAGFPGIWASGLAISAALGVRDSNEASWTQILEVLEFVADATTIPVLVDGDTGYGNFNNVRRLVKKLCQRGIAAVCIEDKLFPKTNSFIGEGQPLADIEEFCGKIRAGKDSQTDGNFSLIARVEALVSGLGLAESLRRAEAYHAAGADAILIHSKARTADEVLRFAAEWQSRCPLIIVPTTYYGTPTAHFRNAGISMVIWANHNMRAALGAMRSISCRIKRDESLIGVEDELPSLRDVFAVTNSAELQAAESRYLPVQRSVTAIILAASRGEELGLLTVDRPKCMIEIRGRPLLGRLVSTFRASGLRDLTVVRGYCADAVDVTGVRYIDHDAYDHTGEVGSLASTAESLSGPCIVSYGDILFRRHILDALLDVEGDIVLAVDAAWPTGADARSGRLRDLVVCSKPASAHYLEEDTVRVAHIGQGVAEAEANGQWIGLLKLSARGALLVRDEIEAMQAAHSLYTAEVPDLIERLIVAERASVSAVYTAGNWVNVNDALDLASAREFI